ncbi:hypothetical protein CUMW_085470 [Citrus unshiu]|nr:hypothetical protein CUMW_085470 [Citrus unshiu]
MIYESLDNALFEKDEKFKKTRLKNPDHNIEKYNLYGFTSGVQMDVLQTLEPNSKESSRKYWLSVKDYLPSIPDWVHKHQPSINAMPSVTRQSDEHDDHDDIPNSIPEQRHDTSEDEVAVDYHQQQTENSDDARDSEAPDDYGVYTDVGNDNLSTPTSLYSFYGDVSGESVQNVRPLPQSQIMEYATDMSTSVDVNPLRGLEDSSLFAEFDRWFTGDSRVRRRVQHPRSFFQIILGTASMGWLGDEHIHKYLRLISEKQRQYPNALLQRVTYTDTFFWVFLNQLWNNGDCAVDSLVFDDRLNSYLCGRQHTMSKSMTDVDMLLILVNLDGAHWVLARVDFRKNKVWIYDSLLTFRDDKRYKLKFKSLEVIFPRWLEYVGFYNIRPELRSADPWKVMAVKSAPQQEPGTGDCGVFVLMVTMYLMFGLRLEFNASHVEYFRKKIAVDIFNDDVVL